MVVKEEIRLVRRIMGALKVGGPMGVARAGIRNRWFRVFRKWKGMGRAMRGR
jgi:hypothetical protein